MAMANVSSGVEIAHRINGSYSMQDDPKTLGLQDVCMNDTTLLRKGYVDLHQPIVECKLEVPDREADSATVSWHDSPGSLIHVKQEFNSCDTNSRESLCDQDGEPQDTLAASRGNCTSTSIPCTSCGYFFTSVVELQEHQILCRVGRVHVCNVCQESFERKSDLSNHLVCHQVNRPHACRTCGSLFRRKADLQNHLVSHQVERPHKCSVCGADFQRHSSLTNHMKIHNYPPGRGIFPTPNSYSNNNSPTSLENTQAVASAHHQKLQFWTPDVKEPIPSFETLPAPGSSFQHFINSMLSQNSQETSWNSSFLNKTLNSKLSNSMEGSTGEQGPQPGAAGPNNLSSPDPLLHQGPGLVNKSEFDGAAKNLASSLPEHLSPENRCESPTRLQATLHFNSSFNETQLTGGSVLPDNSSITDPSYSSVKQVGLLYGVKVEDNEPAGDGDHNLRSSTGVGVPVQDQLHHHKNNRMDAGVSEDDPQDNYYHSPAERPHTCPKCNVSFVRLKAFQSHMRLHNENWNVPSLNSDCSQAFSEDSATNEISLKFGGLPDSSKEVNQSKHENVIHPTDHQQSPTQAKAAFKHVCTECDKKFATKQKLFRHMWIHRKKQFTCEACGTVFGERAALDEHRIALHPPSVTTPFACTECGKSFASRQSLWEHGRVHGSTGPGGAAVLWCQQCSKSFASRQGYQIHIRTHTGERPYGCRYCWKSFRDGGTLRKHERIHTGERPHACPICSRAFNQKVVLREHVRWVHAAATASDSPFPCQICAAVLSDREELCAHIVKHSDDLAALARAAAKEASSGESKTVSFSSGRNVHQHVADDKIKASGLTPLPGESEGKGLGSSESAAYPHITSLMAGNSSGPRSQYDNIPKLCGADPISFSSN